MMNFINKLSKTTIASSMVAASVLGVSNISHASGSGAGPGENAQGQQGQDDAIAFGNTKNPKMLSSWLVTAYLSTQLTVIIKINLALKMNPTAFDKYLKGTNRTYPNDPKENVTDSAAGGTAFATGHKTYNGAISVDNNKKPLKSVLEQAKEQGKSTGLVTTAELTDATPAVYAAHVDSRDKKTKLLNNFIMIKSMANTK